MPARTGVRHNMLELAGRRFVDLEISGTNFVRRRAKRQGRDPADENGEEPVSGAGTQGHGLPCASFRSTQREEMQQRFFEQTLHGVYQTGEV